MKGDGEMCRKVRGSGVVESLLIDCGAVENCFRGATNRNEVHGSIGNDLIFEARDKGRSPKCGDVRL